MRRISWILFAFVVCFVPEAYAKEAVSQCMSNCPPGNNSCVQCCISQQNTAAQPCQNACDATQSKCMSAAAVKCNALPDPYRERICFQSESNACAQANWMCRWNCGRQDWQIPGGCPGEVPPQKCQYDCQMWNSASKSCVGAPMNGCGL